MPIYEYECQTCRRVFEKYQNTVNGNFSITCPYCWCIAHKVISKSHFRLRGGGWAKDNYCKKED